MNNKSENGGQCRPNGKVFGGPAECAGPAGDYMGILEQKIWKKIRIGVCDLTRLVPPRGGGGLNRLRACRRAMLLRIVVVGCADVLFVDSLWFSLHAFMV